MRWLGLAAILLLLAGPGAGIAAAQGATVPFGGAKHDASAPVEITSDQLELDQAAGTAVFTGTVKVAQGTLRLAADRVEVFYDEAAGSGSGPGGSSSGQVKRMVATGDVTLSNGTEAAEAKQATYEVATGTIAMQGDVLLTQGKNALSSETLDINLEAGTAALQGRVQTIFVPGSRTAP